MSGPPAGIVHLRLFVAGDEPNSRRARQVVERLCRRLGPEHVRLETVDVIRDYQAALEHRVLVAPTLQVLTGGEPLVVVGSLEDEDQLLRLLDGADHGDGHG